jgi:hypothetical protein
MILESGVVGSLYSQKVVAASATAVTWTVSTGLLPPGLTINFQTGDIVGTPIVMGIYGFVLTADNGLTSQKGFNITIVDNSGSPAIVTTSLPNGSVGTSYSQTLIASGSSPIAWTITGGTLPTGLNLSPTGEISGTPTTAETATFTVTATNGILPDATKELSITIAATPESLSITTGDLPDGSVNTAYSQTLAVSGEGTVSWSISSGSLPAGLTLNASTGAIAGTPTAAGRKTFTATASSSASTTSKELSITVKGNLAASGWVTPASVNYERNMTYMAQVAFDGVPAQNTNVEVAAFSNGEIRGLARLTYEAGIDVYLVHLTIYSNTTSGDQIVLKAYNPDTKMIYDNCKSFAFQSNESLGGIDETLNCESGN